VIWTLASTEKPLFSRATMSAATSASRSRCIVGPRGRRAFLAGRRRQGGGLRRPRSGQQTKLTNQIAIASGMIGMCEALVFAARAAHPSGNAGGSVIDRAILGGALGPRLTAAFPASVEGFHCHPNAGILWGFRSTTRITGSFAVAS
jgi:hypothetical protein